MSRCTKSPLWRGTRVLLQCTRAVLLLKKEMDNMVGSESTTGFSAISLYNILKYEGTYIYGKAQLSGTLFSKYVISK